MRTFWTEEDGGTALEYALIASMLSVAIIGGVLALRHSLITVYSSISTSVDDNT